MQSAATTDDIKLQNLDEARTLMDNMTKDIRTATLLPVPSATSPFTHGRRSPRCSSTRTS